MFVAAIVVVGLAIIGCGGGGTSAQGGGNGGNGGNAAALRTKVAKAIQSGFATKTESQANAKGTSKEANVLAGSNYRPEYDLWAKEVEGGIDYFADELLTTAAGSERTSYVVNGDDFTSTFTLNLTAGLLSGLTINNSKGRTNGRLVFDLSTNDPREGITTFKGFYTEDEGEFTSTSPGPDGQPRTYITRFFPDGRVQLTYPNDRDFTYSLSYNADQSGSGTVTGNNSLLPATIVWDTNGTGTVTFADGSTLNFVYFEFNNI